MKEKRLRSAFLTSLAVLLSLCANTVFAAPPVRVAVVPGGGSGMEQDIVDRISSELANNPNVKLSTVNPDWFVQCNIVDRTDTGGGSVRVNGTVVIKTLDGHVLNTVSMQTNKQDFSLQPGMPVNKMLFDRAAREVIQGIVDRARQPLAEAIDTEIQTRDKIISAQRMGDDDKYDKGIEVLTQISPDTPHFQGARKLIAEFEMEQDALDAVKEAQILAQKGRYGQAIQTLKAVNNMSKRFPEARSLSARYKSRLANVRPKLAPTQTVSVDNSKTATAAQLKALDAQKKALEAQMKAVTAQEAVLKDKTR